MTLERRGRSLVEVVLHECRSWGSISQKCFDLEPERASHVNSVGFSIGWIWFPSDRLL